MLTSDLSDPGSFANQMVDSRYRDLAAMFSFAADGSVPSGASAQSAEQLNQTVYLNYTKSGNGDTPAAAAFNTTYYGNSIAAVTSVDDLIGNDRLLDYALTAYGIDPSTASTPMLRQVLTSDLSNPNSYASPHPSSTPRRTSTWPTTTMPHKPPRARPPKPTPAGSTP